jgi:hypothetical protein
MADEEFILEVSKVQYLMQHIFAKKKVLGSHYCAVISAAHCAADDNMRIGCCDTAARKMMTTMKAIAYVTCEIPLTHLADAFA